MAVSYTTPPDFTNGDLVTATQLDALSACIAQLQSAAPAGLLLNSRPSSKVTTATTPVVMSGPHTITLGPSPRRILVTLTAEADSGIGGARLTVGGLPSTFRVQQAVGGTTGASRMTLAKAEIFETSGTLTVTWNLIREGGTSEITVSNAVLQITDLGAA